MTNISSPEWTRFQVGAPSTSKWVNKECIPLDSIKHVTHINLALQILVNSKVRAGLVFDKSKLKAYRILVSWLSPNHWRQGSRYGNVSLSFDWNTLVQNSKYYWVESINYSPPAARILVTDQNRDSMLDAYDPTRGDGPWWHDQPSGIHYWNGNFCLEIMVEQDLLLNNCTHIKFVDHHPTFCNIDGYACPDSGLSRIKAASRFLSTTVAQEIDVVSLKWTEGGKPHGDLCEAFNHIQKDLVKRSKSIKYRGKVDASHPAAMSLGRAVLGANGRQNEKDLVRLMDLFHSHDEMLQGCAMAIAETFGLKDWSLLVDDLDDWL